jgi:2-succinyl-5-enolpyruvyl-6-hydroxy-3-cyclohexene-1-carboxylate synthase
MLLQPLINIAEICAKKNVTQVVISPGSRSAALTLAFARHPHIETYVIPDERTAGFIAIGMALASHKPVALICTSGTAASNYAPAITEAFFQEVPLVVFTADRPQEWINQYDGQTVFQQELFGKHVKRAYQLPADYTHPDATWFIERSLNEAINCCQISPQAPVHINVPIREPFYPTSTEVFEYDSNVRIIDRVDVIPQLSSDTWRQLLAIWKNSDRIMVAAGQQTLDSNLGKTLQSLQDEFGVLVVGDVISNLHGSFISKQDLFLQNKQLHTLLQPDLLITFGKSFISKNIKLFLRNNKPRYHWHIGLSENLIDTFQTLTHQIPTTASCFFTKLLEDIDFQAFREGDELAEKEADYLATWQQADLKASKVLFQTIGETTIFTELSVVQSLFEQLPNNCQLHLANSMSVRYANFVGINPNKQIEVFANRGTSGIDGCLSTAVGAALNTDRPVFLLIGDVAFFYDRNALWHPHLPNNLHIILLNNSGGEIFSMIDGPRQQPELQQYFQTQHHTTALRTAQDAGLSYYHCNSLENFQAVLPVFLQEKESNLLEIQTNITDNQALWELVKKKLQD